jgi:hypothetical protein
MRAGFVVPMMGWIRAGCRSNHAIKMASLLMFRAAASSATTAAVSSSRAFRGLIALPETRPPASGLQA